MDRVVGVLLCLPVSIEVFLSSFIDALARLPASEYLGPRYSDA